MQLRFRMPARSQAGRWCSRDIADCWGSPIQSTFDLLKELYDFLPEEDVEGIRVTGSGSQLIAKVLGIYFENEFRAIAKGMRIVLPSCAHGL